jgi:hypothetical protein
MKVFIVFLGLFILQVCYVSYLGDMNRYMARQSELKYMAEECASGAAALWDEKAYGEGELRFDYEKGKVYAEDFVQYRLKDLEGAKEIRVELTFEDQYRGYDPKSPPGIPAVTATLLLEGQDLFRLPFLSVTSIQRQSRYEILENPFV